MAVVPIITSTPRMTRTKSIYQLPLLWLGRIRMCSSGGRINDTIEMVKHPSGIKNNLFFLSLFLFTKKKRETTPKDIERHHSLEVGNEVREQTGHQHDAQSLQHAAPVRDDHLALAAVDPGLQSDQRGVHGDGVGEEADQREADRRDDVEQRGRRDVRENEVLNAFCGSERVGEATRSVRVEDDAAHREEDVHDAGDQQRDDEGVLEARGVLHAGLRSSKAKKNTREERLTKATPMEKQITPNMLAISR